MALSFLGSVVFGVFRKVAMGARFGNRLDDTGTLLLLAKAQLLLQLDESTLSHRYFFYHFFILRIPVALLADTKRNRFRRGTPEPCQNQN